MAVVTMKLDYAALFHYYEIIGVARNDGKLNGGSR